MTQSPYRSSEGHPMRRFGLFAVALFIVVVIGSLPWNGRASKRSSSNSMCVCLPSRAGLILKSSLSAFTRTQAPSRTQSTGTAAATSVKVGSQT